MRLPRLNSHRFDTPGYIPCELEHNERVANPRTETYLSQSTPLGHAFVLPD